MSAAWTAALSSASPVTFTLYEIFTDAVDRLLVNPAVVISNELIVMIITCITVVADSYSISCLTGITLCCFDGHR